MKANTLWLMTGNSEPEWNVNITVLPAYGDQGPAICEERTREMFLTYQEEAEFWKNLREEFWPAYLFED